MSMLPSLFFYPIVAGLGMVQAAQLKEEDPIGSAGKGAGAGAGKKGKVRCTVRFYCQVLVSFIVVRGLVHVVRVSCPCRKCTPLRAS